MTGGERTLDGLSVLVTRASHQSQSLSRRLEELGARVYELPLISIQKPQSSAELDEAIAKVHEYDWIIFASVNAVEFFFQSSASLKLPAPAQKPRFATIGPKTAAALASYGHHSQYHPDEYVAEQFVSQFPEPVSDKAFLWPKANVGRLLIQEELTKAGARVDSVVCYVTSLPDHPDAVATQLVDLLNSGKVDAITLASSQTTRHLQQLCALRLKPADADKLLQSLTAVTIGPETSRAAKAIGLKSIRQAREYTIDGMIAALVELAADRRKSRKTGQI